MAFKAHIDSIDTTGANLLVQVTFTDDATGFTQSQPFQFPTDGTVTLTSARNQIIAAGTVLKQSLNQAVTTATSLQSAVGSSIVI